MWDLDLSEGIDLSIYIFGKFEFEIIKAIAKHKLSKNQFFLILEQILEFKRCNFVIISKIVQFILLNQQTMHIINCAIMSF